MGTEGVEHTIEKVRVKLNVVVGIRTTLDGRVSLGSFGEAFQRSDGFAIFERLFKNE